MCVSQQAVGFIFHVPGLISVSHQKGSAVNALLLAGLCHGHTTTHNVQKAKKLNNYAFSITACIEYKYPYHIHILVFVYCLALSVSSILIKVLKKTHVKTSFRDTRLCNLLCTPAYSLQPAIPDNWRLVITRLQPY